MAELEISSNFSSVKNPEDFSVNESGMNSDINESEEDRKEETEEEEGETGEEEEETKEENDLDIDLDIDEDEEEDEDITYEVVQQMKDIIRMKNPSSGRKKVAAKPIIIEYKDLTEKQYESLLSRQPNETKYHYRIRIAMHDKIKDLQLTRNEIIAYTEAATNQALLDAKYSSVIESTLDGLF